MEKKRKPGKPNPVHQPYNDRMIRDFLEHLEWECRIVHAEHTHLREKGTHFDQKPAPELTHALGTYLKRRGSVLTMATSVSLDGMAENEKSRVLEAIHEAQRKRMAKALLAFNDLRDIFEEALECIEITRANGRNAFPIRSVTADNVEEFLARLGDNHGDQPNTEKGD